VASTGAADRSYWRIGPDARAYEGHDGGGLPNSGLRLLRRPIVTTSRPEPPTPEELASVAWRQVSCATSDEARSNLTVKCNVAQLVVGRGQQLRLTAWGDLSRATQQAQLLAAHRRLGEARVS